MGDASAAAGWTAEDDVLLKSAVEAGASLESLAKGAVCFSHKFTLPELQDRWYSLLYDSETSAQASARMAKFETELSASNPAKASKLFNPKAKCFSLFKRKIDSVKNYYYAMRKRIRHEPCLSDDFCHSIAPCSCNPVDSGGCACGERHLLHKVDPSGSVVGGYGFTDGCGGRKHVHSNGNGQYTFDSEHSNSDGSMVIDGNTNHESPHGCSDVGKLYGCDDMQKISQTSGSNVLYTNNRSDATDWFDHGAKGSKAPLGIHQDGVNLDQSSGNTTGRFPDPGAFKAISQKRCLQEPSVPTCSKVLGVKFDMLIDMQKIEGETLMLSDDKKMEINSIDALAYQANCDSVVCDSGLGRAMAPEGGFMHSQLKGFSQKEDLDLCSDLFPDCALETNKEDLGPHPLDTSNCDNRIDPIQQEPNVVDVSGVGSIPTSSEVLYPEHNVKCMLNKEDSEIPVNDCIPIPGQTSLEPTSTFDRDSQHDGRLVAKLINMENGQPSSPAPLVNLESAILEQNANMVPLKEGCAVGSELTPGLHGNFGGNNANTCTTSALHSVDGGEETTCGFTKHESCYDLQNLSFDKSIQVSNQMNCKFLAHKPRIGGCETAIHSCELASALPDKDFHDPLATISTMGQAEGSDNETSVPNYVDLEALILDLDLIPWDQESDFIQPEVSRFQYPESRKDLIRLEKGACSYMNRSIISKGAFAILYGQHMKYYMREPEVSLGRATEEVHVDIDLSKEGKANKISRRQAVIKMDDDGSFYITNTGKCSIFVNSKEVPCSKRISLMSDDSLIEIRNLKFIFHVNHKAARQYIARKRRESSSQGQNAAFDWSQNDP